LDFETVTAAPGVEPFTAWTPAVEAMVRGWLVDTTPDALAYSIMYIAGAPAAVDPRLFTTGVDAPKQVLGEARYVPTEADGKRQADAPADTSDVRIGDIVTFNADSADDRAAWTTTSACISGSTATATRCSIRPGRPPMDRRSARWAECRT